MTEPLTPLKPVPWPLAWKHSDKLVPVISGSEALLCCVYVAAPVPDCSPTRISFTDKLAKRMRNIRSETIPTTGIPGNCVELFWAAWFTDVSVGRRVAVAAQQYLEKLRILSGETRAKTDWFTARPEWAKQAILVAAAKLDARPIHHETYVKLCRWRGDLSLDRRIPRTKREIEAYKKRALVVAQLAIKAGAIPPTS